MRLEYLTPNDWALLRSRSHSRLFRKGEFIIPINSRPSSVFILKNGSATVEVTRGNPIAKLTTGDICGEMSFIENTVASASVVADSDTEVDVLDLPEISAIFDSYPHLEARFYKSIALLLSRRLRRTSSELAKSMAKT